MWRARIIRRYCGEGGGGSGGEAEVWAQSRKRDDGEQALPIAPVFGGPREGLGKWAKRSAIRCPAIQRNSHLKPPHPN